MPTGRDADGRNKIKGKENRFPDLTWTWLGPVGCCPLTAPAQVGISEAESALGHDPAVSSGTWRESHANRGTSIQFWFLLTINIDIGRQRNNADFPSCP
jgi:hypothetical protein